jgi:OmpA-OmpF porin, OOP family
MKNKILFVFAVLLLESLVIKAQDNEYKDTPWLSGMPNFTIYDAQDTDFDGYNFFNGNNCITVEGKKYKRTYTLKEDAQKSSIIQISRNYANAIRNMGGTVIFDGAPQNAECADNNGLQMVVGKVIKDGNEMWIEVVPTGDGSDYYLTIVLKELMKQDVTASDMFEALNKDGHISLYINFDTGKSVIRPESGVVIGQIVQLMKSNPGLKLSIEGHTDNVGNASSNKILSEERAKSVVTAIAGQGISIERMSSSGFGQDKPIADNNTEEGRAKNRRVELVKK